MTRPLTLFILIFLFSCALGGCAAPKPDYIHESFMVTPIGTITVLPVIDGRTNPNPKHNFEDITSRLPKQIMSVLKRQKYNSELTEDIGQVSKLTPKALSDTSPSWIKNLGPSNSDWVMVFMVTDIKTEFGFLSVGGKVNMAGYLFNKRAGLLWWYHSGTGKFGTGVLTAGVFRVAGWTMEQTAAEMALTDLIGVRLPQRSKIKPDR